MALFLAGWALGGQAAAQLTEWSFHKTGDGLHPSPLEQQMLWLMNQARANPLLEGLKLDRLDKPSIKETIRRLRVDMTKMKLEFSLIPPAAPATFDSRLYEASKKHSEYMISVNRQTHDGQSEELYEVDFIYTAASLSVLSACEDAMQCHGVLNIDFGATPDGMQNPRGHRDAIMSNRGIHGENFSSVGLAMVPCSSTANVGPYCFSAAYAASDDVYVDHYNRFVVGTVWTDANKNGQYDPGEGMRGVRVGADRGDFYAVTGEAGGYSFPVEEEGAYMVNFSGGRLSGTLLKPVTVGPASVLVDAELSDFKSAPPLPMASTLRVNRDGDLRLRWSGGAPPYQIQKGESPAGPWLDAGGPTMELTAVFPIQGRSGYFRIRSAP